jgi:hypothetical protein
VGDPEFADVRFIAEGRAIVAHRFILESRCAYFRAMFRSGMAESGGGHHNEMVDVVVPGKRFPLRLGLGLLMMRSSPCYAVLQTRLWASCGC